MCIETLLQKLSDNLVKELTAMSEIGIPVSDKALSVAKDPARLEEYLGSGIGVSDLADLFTQLYPS